MATEYDSFVLWVARAIRAFHLGRDKEAAALAHLAARYIYRTPVGIFYSAELESLLQFLSSKISITGSGHASNQTPHKVLHVLTRAYDIGGHTRLVWRWIETDKRREHHVAITDQDVWKVPHQLQCAVKKSGGQLHILDKSYNLAEIATNLRQLGTEFDLIVLHIHTYDVTPLIAWGSVIDHPPIALLNHADHIFWLGASLADVVINIRRSGQRVSLLRRGISEERNAILPVPLGDGLPKRSRQHARAELSIDDDELVALTVATEGKFIPFKGVDFAKFHQPLLERHDKLRLIVVGPSPAIPYWKQWSRITNERIQAVGIQTNVATYLSAADIYLDSFPFASLTSLLEAALSGVPTVAWHPYPDGDLANVLSFDDPAFDGLPLAYSDKTQYFARIDKLLTCAEEAKSYVHNVKVALLKTHTSDSWLDKLEAVYHQTTVQATKRPHSMSGGIPTSPGVLDEILQRDVADLSFIEETNAERFLPYLARLRYLLEDHASLHDIMKALVPIPTRRLLRQLNASLREKCGVLLRFSSPNRQERGG